MTNIKPISDLRNYTEVLNEVREDSPVYLTRNGRGEYAILKIEDLDKLQAASRLLERQQAVKILMEMLEEGERSGREDGWLSADEVDAELGW